jgi:uncharacterized protein
MHVSQSNTPFGAIAVFVKTPEFSPLKTRLAKDVGPQAAQQFYQLAYAAVASVLQQAEQVLKLKVYWAVAEPEAVQHPRWSQFETCSQGSGGLGQRMQHVYHSLLKQHAYVLLLGADAPQICLEDFLQADTVLRSKTPQYLLAPAADGGFWSVAGNCTIASHVWRETHYSSADTLRTFELLLSAHHHASAAKLRTLTDVDTLADWHRARVELMQLTRPTLAQADLLSLTLERMP